MFIVCNVVSFALMSCRGFIPAVSALPMLIFSSNHCIFFFMVTPAFYKSSSMTIFYLDAVC